MKSTSAQTLATQIESIGAEMLAALRVVVHKLGLYWEQHCLGQAENVALRQNSSAAHRQCDTM
jgi:hypothetical protein